MQRTLRDRVALVAGPSLLSTAFSCGNPQSPGEVPEGEMINAGRDPAPTAEGKAVCVGPREPLRFGKGHVPGAMALSDRERCAHAVDIDASFD